MVGPPLNKCDDDDVIWGVDSRGGDQGITIRWGPFGRIIQRHDVIGCRETRTVGAQSIRALFTPSESMFFYLQNFSSPTPVKFSLCAANEP